MKLLVTLIAAASIGSTAEAIAGEKEDIAALRALDQAYATEWTRLVVLLQAMQGLGKPGVSLWGTTMGPPFNAEFEFPGYASDGYGMNNLAKKAVINPVSQRIYRLILPEAILNPPPMTMRRLCGRGSPTSRLSYPGAP